MKVKSCNALLHKLLVCIRNYLKSVMRYKILILDTFPLREQGYEDLWLFFGAKVGASQNVWQNCSILIFILILLCPTS
jgi:hypothetical protein